MNFCFRQVFICCADRIHDCFEDRFRNWRGHWLQAGSDSREEYLQLLISGGRRRELYVLSHGSDAGSESQYRTKSDDH